MQRFASFAARTAVTAASRRSLAMARTIPTDLELQGGRRKEEVEAAAAGQALFNLDPVIPPVNAGTKENPILVPSEYDERPVGYEDPVTHQMCWFNMHAGATYYVPEIGLYFKLQFVH